MPKIKHCWLLIMSALFIFACTSLPRISWTPDKDQAIVESEKTKAERKKEAQSYSLEEKAALLENNLNNFIRWPYYLLSEYKTENKLGPAHIEHTSFLLSFLTAKFAATQDEKTEQSAKLVIKSIIALDKCNGLDGFLPLEAEVDNRGELYATNENTHANVYVQLFFAYVDAYLTFHNHEIKEMISEHTALIAKHFLKHDYKLHDQRGQKMAYGDLSIKQNTLCRSCALTTELLTVSSLKMINFQKHPELKEQLREKMRLLKQLNYRDKGPLFFKFFKLEFPTPGSTHLNFLSLESLRKLTGENYYAQCITKLYGHYHHSANIFFDIIYLNSAKNIKLEQRKILEKRIIFYLNSYPLTRDSSVILNSYRQDIKIRTNRYIKLQSEPEAVIPLPIYDRPGTDYEWIRNQHRLDGGGGKKRIFHGIDFLQAYWLFKRYQSTPP